ncbi:MAG: glycine cleavage system aminomethyltransferase GcvT [Spirochaetes bacterium]|nr:glycine cleavage system aminomethyltransferase GcvT [Spirochaetota bacterium]
MCRSSSRGRRESISAARESTSASRSPGTASSLCPLFFVARPRIRWYTDYHALISKEARTRETALHDWHKAKGARMAPFAGYEMPISYPTGAIEEHKIARRSVGLFDIDHMGQFEVSGPGADAFVSRMASARVSNMVPPMARYSLLLDEEGKVIDDLFLYRMEKSWWIVVNASNREKDLTWMKDHLVPGVSLEDRSDEIYMIAVQGPKALALLNALSSPKPSSVDRFCWLKTIMAGIPVLFGRTGYTGEDGGELFFPTASALQLWEGLLAEGERLGIETKPIGLAARDSLRFEAGMPLHGHEISPEINAIEAGFRWACDFDKDFIGAETLKRILAEGPSRRLVCLDVSGGVPREGYEVTDTSGRIVGRCVAGMYCPTVNKYAANAFVEPPFSTPGSSLQVIIRGQGKPAAVVKRPLYVPAYRR